MKIEVYTKSNCVWCVRTKELLNTLQLNYNEFMLDVDFTKAELLDKLNLEADSKITLPQVFIGGASIGGYEDLMEYLEQTGIMGLQT
jgi:glutaredoxin 3